MNKPTICVDLDATLATYKDGWRGIEHIGDPIPGAVEFTRQLSEFANVVIFTCRCKEGFGDSSRGSAEQLRCIVKAWLDRHGFAYADVYTGQGKPVAVAYVDDRAVDCRPDRGHPEQEYKRALGMAKDLCRV